MKNFLRMLMVMVGLSGFVAVTPVRAEMTPTWEVYGGANTSFGANKSGNERFQVFGSLGATGGYFVTPTLELLGSLSVDIDGGGAGYTNVTPRVGLNFNFGDEPVNGFFVGGLIGPAFHHFSLSNQSYVSLSYRVHAGRRVFLFSHVSWAPQFYFSGYTSATSGRWTMSSWTEIGFAPILFSVLF